MFLDSGEQLLIYIRGKRRVRKSKVVKAIVINFILFCKRKKLVISMPTGSVANGIDRNTMHIVLNIDN